MFKQNIESCFSRHQSIDSDESSSEKGLLTEKSFKPISPWRHRSVQVSIVIPWLLLAILSSAWVSSSNSRCKNAQILYSPAQHLSNYEIKKFSHGFNTDISKYQGEPNDEKDRAWEDLYNFGMTSISHDSASRLANRTGEIPGLPGKYLVELDVFHQLHCLNNIRMYKYRSTGRYSHTFENEDVPHDFTDSHVDHCIDTIRQSLMCHADLTPLVWQWSEEQGGMRMHGDVVHSCRNFDVIRSWAKENQVHISLDPYQRKGEAGGEKMYWPRDQMS